MPPRRNYEEIEDEVENQAYLHAYHIKASLPKSIEKELISEFRLSSELFFDSVWDYHYQRTEEFFNQLQHTLPSMIQKMQNRLAGLMLLGLAFLTSVGISVFLIVSGLPDAGRLFIYPAILSLIMFILVLTKKEGDTIVRESS